MYKFKHKHPFKNTSIKLFIFEKILRQYHFQILKQNTSGSF